MKFLTKLALKKIVFITENYLNIDDNSCFIEIISNLFIEYFDSLYIVKINNDLFMIQQFE